ncbi:VanW family protein [Desmospora profundinema]|uniref:Vancomycin resistance protein YoaR n=1 Tax=Desmospora profundinema TaxID=1571184 RepID=A0ABU1IM17_9BACL|nr:VanW family protein [Desmospora profundinema]MDR6225827.1 vancomycin resistance protein YoaR [Desmospora profundinema]
MNEKEKALRKAEPEIPDKRAEETEKKGDPELSESTKSGGDPSISNDKDGPGTGLTLAALWAKVVHLSEEAGRRLLDGLKQTPLAKRFALDRIQPVPFMWTSLTLGVFAVAGLAWVSLQPLSPVSHADSVVEEAGDPEEAEVEAEPEPEPLPLILVHGDQRWEMDLRKWGYDGEDPSTLDKEKWEKWLKSIAKEVQLPAQNAKAERFGGTIQPAKEGRKMDLEAMDRWLEQLPTRLNHPEVIPTVPVAPRVTENDIRRVNEKRIGTYTTYLNAGNVNRTTNVRLSSDAIHNRVLNPGEEFSFNQTVGQRTTARGYKPATIIVKGEYSEGLGGGICQTSSTLYNSVDNAGLEITARYSHSAEVTYVPKGRDATVAWHGPDFRFRNNLDRPILIRSFLQGGSLTVEVYSSNDTKNQSRQVQSAPTEVEDMVPSGD